MSHDNSYAIAHFAPPLWRHERAWWKLEPQHTQHWRCSHVRGNWYLGVKVFWKTWNKVLVDMIWNTVCHEFLMMSCLILLLVILFLCLLRLLLILHWLMYRQAYCLLEVRASQFQGDYCSDRQSWSLKIWILDTAGETEMCSEPCWRIDCACKYMYTYSENTKLLRTVRVFWYKNQNVPINGGLS